MGRTIANGAFSKVKLVQHSPTGVEYVAKILPKSNVDVENDIRVEISILRRVRHEHVVQLIEILESPRNYYIILEPVMGGDLCNLIMDQPDGLPEPEAARIFSQLLKAVTACHNLGVAHRDLKPENCLLTREGNVKISDFGLSRLHSVSTNEATAEEYAKTLTGTLAYVAPEVLLGTYDAFKADTWSLGCILYVMLTGRFPFGGAQGKELEMKIKAGEIVPLPPRVSAEARDLVGQLLSWNARDRPSLTAVSHHPFLASVLDDSAFRRMGQCDLADSSQFNQSFARVDDESVMSPVGGGRGVSNNSLVGISGVPNFAQRSRKLPGT